MTQQEANKVIKSIGNRTCRKCGGWMYVEDNEKVCANCGHNEPLVILEQKPTEDWTKIKGEKQG